ncbi:hypothetical protein U27_01317 [Candidatus Vecturithrix granuli]|uniref:Uncharacterized protein n=1 Tax=Vecturithrix granuli TaxID=1499967 RepID=A0A081CA12_VECG1|nr:hypothetical protein U27_01317 [Candidatus Vecturithrix granuli]
MHRIVIAAVIKLRRGVEITAGVTLNIHVESDCHTITGRQIRQVCGSIIVVVKDDMIITIAISIERQDAIQRRITIYGSAVRHIADILRQLNIEIEIFDQREDTGVFQLDLNRHIFRASLQGVDYEINAQLRYFIYSICLRGRWTWVSATFTNQTARIRCPRIIIWNNTRQ